MGSPPGGPPDATPPTVTQTVPPAGATEVPADADLRVTFSERMDHGSVEAAISLWPRVGRRLRFDWSGSTLRLVPETPLGPDTSFVLTIAPTAQDGRRNGLSAPVQVAFSTGSSLARGQVRGRILAFGRGQGTPWAIAYAAPDGGDEVPIGSAQPLIAAPADSGGHFVLGPLPPGRYRVFAVVDRDGDLAYAPGEEALAVPPWDAAFSDDGGTIALGLLEPSVEDTLLPRLEAVEAPDDRQLRLRFSKPIASAGNLRIVEAGTTRELPVLAAFPDPRDPKAFMAVTPRRDPGASYVLAEITAEDDAGVVAELLLPRDVPQAAAQDTTPPVALEVSPADSATSVARNASVMAEFAEAVVARPDAALRVERLGQQGGDPVAGRSGQPRPTQLTFQPDSVWASGATYRAILDLAAIRDHAGHTAGSSPRTWIFTAEDTRRLGTFVATVVAHPEQDGAVVLALRELGAGAGVYPLRVPRGRGVVSFDVPGGQYEVRAFWDRDGDGVRDSGSALPFQPSEVQVVADTVAVRERWRSTGVTVRLPPPPWADETGP